MNTTQWYQGHQKPVRAGVYQRAYPWGVQYARWNGRKWADSDATAMHAAARPETSISYHQDDLKWRGLRRAA